MISITAFTKEKTAKIIPNAVAVSTTEDTHTFTSFISREATYKVKMSMVLTSGKAYKNISHMSHELVQVMTKAWRKALSKHNLANLVRRFFRHVFDWQNSMKRSSLYGVRDDLFTYCWKIFFMKGEFLSFLFDWNEMEYILVELTFTWETFGSVFQLIIK